jgi:hypothetical protein
VIQQHPLEAVVVLDVVPTAVLDSALVRRVKDAVLAAGGAVAGSRLDFPRTEEVAESRRAVKESKLQTET